jgi:hypothetical protein
MELKSAAKVDSIKGIFKRSDPNEKIYYWGDTTFFMNFSTIETIRANLEPTTTDFTYFLPKDFFPNKAYNSEEQYRLLIRGSASEW